MSSENIFFRANVLRRIALHERYGKYVVARRILMDTPQQMALDTHVNEALHACETEYLPCVDITKWTCSIEEVVLVLRGAGISVGWLCSCPPSSVRCQCTHKNATEIQMCFDTTLGSAGGREFP